LTYICELWYLLSLRLWVETTEFDARNTVPRSRKPTTIPWKGPTMKVDRAILAGAAAVQFCSLALVADPPTRTIGFAIGMMTGVVLLLLALGVQQGTLLRFGKRSGT
jgi:hypothetical protein